MAMPIVEALAAYRGKGYMPFHMPGHKGGRAWRSSAGSLGDLQDGLWAGDFWQGDLTEVPGLDDLACPQGAIAEAERLAAQAFGAQRSFFLVNGATVGIQALMLALCAPSDQVLIPRHAHRSLWAGLVLSGAWPVYLRPQLHPRLGFPLGISVEETCRALGEAPGARLLWVVHPSYYGLTSPVPAIIQEAERAGVAVVADEAHGSHFRWDQRLPAPALACGAKASVQSWHKTLVSLTQSAVLHLSEERWGQQVAGALRLLQSSSPSYLLLASLDACRELMATQGRSIWGRVVDLALEVRRQLAELFSQEGLELVGEEALALPGVGGWDPTRLVISAARGWGLDGAELAASLRDEGIQVEMADAKSVVLLLTPGDNQESASLLVRAFKRIGQRMGKAKAVDKAAGWTGSLGAGGKTGPEGGQGVGQEADSGSGRGCGAGFGPEGGQGAAWAAPWPLPQVALSPRQAYLKLGSSPPPRAVKLEEARDLVAAEMLCPYPPGAPLICPGEVMSAQVMAWIKELRGRKLYFQGASDPSLKTILVWDH